MLCGGTGEITGEQVGGQSLQTQHTSPSCSCPEVPVAGKTVWLKVVSVSVAS